MTNEQAKAYAALAMMECGIPKKKIREVLDEMKWLMDMVSEEEAEAKHDRLVIAGKL